MSPSFSIVLISRNEEKTLPRLIESLEEFKARGGGIILVDTGSTDGTAALARKLGCMVFAEGERFMTTINETLAKQINRRFVCHGEADVVAVGDKLFDYSNARNYAASLSATDMVAMPDCDEAFTRLDLDKIEEEIGKGAERFEYNFVFSHDEFGGEAIKFLHSKFYNRKVMSWTGVVHEVLQGATEKVCRLGEEHIKLEHWQNPSPHRSRYLTGLALDCYKNPGNDRNCHYFAREMLWNGRPHSALREFHRHVGMNAWPAERAQSMIFMGDACQQIGKEALALEWYHKAIDVDGGRREAWLRLAELYWKKNDHQRVASYAQAALAIPRGNYYANQMAHYTSEPHARLYWALWYMGQPDEAARHWEKALEYEPLNQKFIDDGQFFVKPHGDHRISTLRYMIQNIINFSFVKLGDGEQECMDGKVGGNCDGHAYSGELGNKLKRSFEYLKSQAMVFDYHDQKNVNMLLHRTDNDLQALRAFYKAIRHAPREKIFIGPARLKGVSSMLQTRFVEVPELNAFNEYDAILGQAKALIRDHAIYMVSAGPAAKCLIADLLAVHPRITCLDTGSAFDPIFGPASRTYQMDRLTLQKLYSDLLPFPKVSIIIPTLGREERFSKLLERISANAGYSNYEIKVAEDKFPPFNQGVPRMVKKLVADSDGELIMYLGNDCLPGPDFLIKAVLKHQQSFPDGIGLVGLNDGYWHGEIATHWLASRSLLPLLDGEFFHTGYYHNGCDNELTERCKKMGKYVWCEESEVRHDHPILKGFRPDSMDEVNRLAYDPSRLEHDRALLKQRSLDIGFVHHDFYIHPGIRSAVIPLRSPRALSKAECESSPTSMT